MKVGRRTDRAGQLGLRVYGSNIDDSLFTDCTGWEVQQVAVWHCPLLSITNGTRPTFQKQALAVALHVKKNETMNDLYFLPFLCQSKKVLSHVWKEPNNFLLNISETNPKIESTLVSLICKLKNRIKFNNVLLKLL